MAPPANRRSGYSRRAQYSTFFGYLAGVLGALIGAVLLILSIRNPDLFSGPRQAATATVEPAGIASAGTSKAGRDAFSILEGYVLAGTRYDKLSRELARARSDLAEAQAIKSENRRLKRLLGLVEADPRPVAVSRLIGSTAASSRRFATIDAGRDQGVAVGMPVRSILGLVGRVLEAGPRSARVLLVTDTQSLVPVRRVSDDVAGFAQGRGDGTLQVRLIDLGLNPLKKGDVLVTSGAGGLFRTGIPVAVMTHIATNGGRARVLSNPASADYVIIEQVSARATPTAARPATAPTIDATAPSAGTGRSQ